MSCQNKKDKKEGGSTNNTNIVEAKKEDNKKAEQKNVDTLDPTYTEVKGLLRFMWRRNGKNYEEASLPPEGEDPLGGLAVYLEFTPEDMDKYMDTVLMVWPEDINGGISAEEMYNKVLETVKEIFGDISRMSKDEYGYLSQPVKLVLKPVKIYGGCCAAEYYYAEIVKAEKIDSTTVEIPKTELTSIDFSDRIFYLDKGGRSIFSKEGYTNVRKGPSKEYDIIDKLENESPVYITQKFGDWYYALYFIYDGKKDGEDPESKYGFIHKSQIIEMK